MSLLSFIVPAIGLLASVGVKSVIVVEAGMPSPEIISPCFIPPRIPSMFIAVPAVIVPDWFPFIKAIAAEDAMSLIGILSITLTARESDSLYNISNSFIFKASCIV